MKCQKKETHGVDGGYAKLCSNNVSSTFPLEPHTNMGDTLKVEVGAGAMGDRGGVHNTSAFATRKRETAFNR